MIGRIIQLGVGKEATRGTVKVPDVWVPKYEATVRDKRESVDNEQSMGNIAKSDGARIVKEFSGGEISGKVLDQSFGYFLLGALGAVSTADKSGDTAVKLHTFNMQNSNKHQSLTLEMKDDVEQMAYALAIISSLKINAEMEKFVEFETEFIGKKGVAATSTPAYTAENEFVPQDITIKFATSMAGLDAASETKLQKVELTIDKDPEQENYLGSAEPAGAFNKSMSIEVAIETLFDATTLKDYFTGDTPMAMRIEMHDTNTTIGTGSNPGLQIDLPKITFPEWEVSGGNDDLVSQSLTIKGHYDLTNAKLIQAILTNLKTSY